MNPYYQYQFISPEPLISLVQEELRGYLDTGAIDSAIWSVYIDKCLQKLGRGSYKIENVILNIKDFQARLPDNFFAVREAWLATEVSVNYQAPNADYQQVTTTKLNDNSTYCSPCTDCPTPDVIRAVYKTTHTIAAHYKRHYLLKPGNMWAKGACDASCANLGGEAQNSPESFDIRDNKFTVTFRDGNVYLLYYTKEYDENGYQLIPDNYRIKEFIEAFIKQKVFEQLSNQATDETFNQITQKAMNYKQMADEAYIMALTEAKKETIYKKAEQIKKTQHRFDFYNRMMH